MYIVYELKEMFSVGIHVLYEIVLKRTVYPRIRFNHCVLFHSEHSSPAFEEFLELIGTKVKMKGFAKYRAQLDNKSKRDRDVINIHVLHLLA